MNHDSRKLSLLVQRWREDGVEPGKPDNSIQCADELEAALAQQAQPLTASGTEPLIGSKVRIWIDDPRAISGQYDGILIASEPPVALKALVTTRDCEFAAKVLRTITSRLHPDGDMRTLASIARTLDMAGAALREVKP